MSIVQYNPSLNALTSPSIVITYYSFSDSASSADSVSTPQVPITVAMPGVIYGGVNLPLITPGTEITFTVPVCMPSFFSLSKFSGNITLSTHCPNEIIQPSVWNNRRAVLMSQLYYINMLMQRINFVSPATYNNLFPYYSNIMNKLNTLTTVNKGDYVSHEYYNVIYDFISFAQNVYYNYSAILLGTFGTVPSQITNYFNAMGYVLTRMYKKSSMDIMLSKDWNNLTNALIASDNILQFLMQYLGLWIKLQNPGYSYQSNQQIPIAINPSNLQSQYNIIINEDLSNVLFFDSSGNKIPFWVEVDANNNNGTTVAWLKLTDTVINQLNSGSATILMVPQLQDIFDGVNFGINSAITGNFNLDNIVNIMDQGLAYSIWNDGNSTSGAIGPIPNTNEPLIGTPLNQSVVNFILNGQTYKASLTYFFNITNLFKGTVPCVIQSGSYSNCSSCTNSPQCSSVSNMIFDWQNGYCCGSPAPYPATYVWLAKAIGWVQSTSNNTIYALSDDGINVWTALTGELGSDGANFASNGNNILSSWESHPIPSTPFTGSIPPGTYRFELHYANFFVDKDALYAWFAQPVNLYHAKFVPQGMMPSYSIST